AGGMHGASGAAHAAFDLAAGRGGEDGDRRDREESVELLRQRAEDRVFVERAGEHRPDLLQLLQPARGGAQVLGHRRGTSRWAASGSTVISAGVGPRSSPSAWRVSTGSVVRRKCVPFLYSIDGSSLKSRRVTRHMMRIASPRCAGEKMQQSITPSSTAMSGPNEMRFSRIAPKLANSTAAARRSMTSPSTSTRAWKNL